MSTKRQPSARAVALKELENELFAEFRRIVGCDPWTCGPGTRARLRKIIRKAAAVGAQKQIAVMRCEGCREFWPPAQLTDGHCVDCWDRKTMESFMNEIPSGGPA